jgi:hypothetical protein
MSQVAREFDLHAGAAMLDHVMVIAPQGPAAWLERSVPLVMAWRRPPTLVVAVALLVNSPG